MYIYAYFFIHKKKKYMCMFDLCLYSILTLAFKLKKAALLIFSSIRTLDPFGNYLSYM